MNVEEKAGERGVCVLKCECRRKRPRECKAVCHGVWQDV